MGEGVIGETCFRRMDKMSQFNKSVLVFKHRQLLIKSWVIKFSIILILKLIFDKTISDDYGYLTTNCVV